MKSQILFPKNLVFPMLLEPWTNRDRDRSDPCTAEKDRAGLATAVKDGGVWCCVTGVRNAGWTRILFFSCR
ncbi:MAG: hypothetical protein ACFFD4_04365 [Candidatus Odinarchaeota archaeon]